MAMCHTVNVKDGGPSPSLAANDSQAQWLSATLLTSGFSVQVRGESLKGAIMKYTEKLQAWVKDRVENHGLIDIKFDIKGSYPFEAPTTASLEDLAKEAYEMLTCENCIDITNERL